MINEKVNDQISNNIFGNNDCATFAEQITNGAYGFKVWEDRECVIHTDRDKAIVEWTIRCLANTKNELSEKVIESIKSQRLKS